MYSFSYDLIRDYNFDADGFPISRKKDVILGRRNFVSNAKSLKAAVADFLRNKDKGTLYDIDEEVVEITDQPKSFFVDWTQSSDGTWAADLLTLKQDIGNTKGN